MIIIYEVLEYSDRYDREGSLLYTNIDDAKKQVESRINEYLSWNTPSQRHEFKVERPSELEANVFDTWTYSGEYRVYPEATFRIKERRLREKFNE